MPSPTSHTVRIPGRGPVTVALRPGRGAGAPRGTYGSSSRNDLLQVALGKISDIKKRKARIEEDLVAIGLALVDLSRPELYDALKCSSFEEVVDQYLRGVFNRDSASKLKTIVQQIPAADLHTLGRAKAWEVVFLARETGMTINDALAITINGLRLHDPAINAATIHKLAEALGVQPGATPPPRASAPDTPETKAARAAATKLQRNLRRAGATDAAVRARLIDGVWWFRLDVPLSQSSHVTVT